MRPRIRLWSPAGVSVGVALCLALLAGCAGRSGETGEPAGREPYPDWVRMVPTPTEESRWYVGGCSRASSLEEAVAAARIDVEAEVISVERAKFLALFDRVLKEARTKTTSVERARFRNDGGLRYAEEVTNTLVREDVDRSACAGGPEDVCNVFVLFRLDEAEADAVMQRTLREIRRTFREEGNTELAEVAERMQREIEQTASGQTR